jgi:hypothetical protein
LSIAKTLVAVAVFAVSAGSGGGEAQTKDVVDFDERGYN